MNKVMQATGAIQVGESGTQLKKQLAQYPSADIWQVPAGAHTQGRHLTQVHAVSPGHLEEALRDAVTGAGLVMPQ